MKRVVRLPHAHLPVWSNVRLRVFHNIVNNQNMRGFHSLTMISAQATACPSLLSPLSQNFTAKNLHFAPRIIRIWFDYCSDARKTKAFVDLTAYKYYHNWATSQQAVSKDSQNYIIISNAKIRSDHHAVNFVYSGHSFLQVHFQFPSNRSTRNKHSSLLPNGSHGIGTRLFCLEADAKTEQKR
ncbi:Hypothetical_protein [Hexamita inflata]|uniref:Hypothetical_protein n=1 Tax=Hexamita inflata TaxID=28002 RepID=A0AA86R1H0_9EUKA|nr:Hypothetical protein HINF_LOCUS52132 [Hexamita inflata]